MVWASRWRKNLIRADIKAGTLVTPFENMVKAKQSYIVIFRKEDALLPRIRLFLDWLKSQGGESS
ncbi:hypothetical protein FACS1894158_00420 [Betaproteobacteria bacterium]|nr:hypothetical protein FACS1894158_00420 [Betaproteobacteria bacterium]